jgi:FkbM family methyltransferase
MGFMVIAIDALDKYKSEWKNERPNAELLVTAVGDSVGILDFEESEHDGYEGDMYSAVKGQSNKAKNLNRINKKISVNTLTNILQEKKVFNVGIMSMDIEGFELSALHGLDFDKIKVRIIILENNSTNNFGEDSVRQYMHSKGYIFKARIWGLDDVYELAG